MINLLNNYMSTMNQGQKLEDIVKQDYVSLSSVLDEDSLVSELKEGKQYILK